MIIFNMKTSFKKPIIATTLAGLFLKHTPWETAHMRWFKEAAEQLNDPSVNKWAKKPDYFKGVDEVMQRLYPNLTNGERTAKARELYFDAVLNNIKDSGDVRNEKVIEYFKKLKKDYALALITTNKQESLNKILALVNLLDLFDIIEASLPEEKDDKTIVFDRFIERYGKPIVYIGGGKSDTYAYCQQNNIPAIFANFESQESIESVETVHTLEDLKQKISKFLNF